MLYSKLGHEAPFIASMILSAIDFLMRLVVIEKSSAPKEWFEEKNVNNAHDLEKNSSSITVVSLSCEAGEQKKDDKPQHNVTWLQLLRQPRLMVSLALTAVVATVMSAFEVSIYIYIYIT